MDSSQVRRDTGVGTSCARAHWRLGGEMGAKGFCGPVAFGRRDQYSESGSFRAKVTDSAPAWQGSSGCCHPLVSEDAECHGTAWMGKVAGANSRRVRGCHSRRAAEKTRHKFHGTLRE